MTEQDIIQHTKLTGNFLVPKTLLALDQNKRHILLRDTQHGEHHV